MVIGCGHAGDGNVHLSVFQPDAGAARAGAAQRLRAPSAALGGAVSGEHGIGTDKRSHFLALENPAKLALMGRIKAAFDPDRHPQSRARCSSRRRELTSAAAR